MYVENVQLIDLSMHSDFYGSLIAIEELQDIPFNIKRVYYIFDVGKDIRRGFHSHRNLQQALICLHGSVKILVKTPYSKDNILLTSPQKALLIGPMVWREMYDFSPDAVLLVLASDHFIPDDYICDYTVYAQEAKAYFDTQKDISI